MLTSLSSELFNVANIQSMTFDICPTYTGQSEQRKYTIKQWYEYQMRLRSTNKPNATREENWNWFKHTQYYSKWYFHKRYAQIKANKPTKLKPTKAPPTSPSLHETMANNIGDILFQYKYDNNMDILYNILDELSNRGGSPEIFKTIGIGECMMTMIEIYKVLKKLESNTDSDSKRVKQILLSAMLCYDGDKITNKSLHIRWACIQKHQGPCKEK